MITDRQRAAHGLTGVPSVLGPLGRVANPFYRPTTFRRADRYLVGDGRHDGYRLRDRWVYRGLPLFWRRVASLRLRKRSHSTLGALPFSLALATDLPTRPLQRTSEAPGAARPLRHHGLDQSTKQKRARPEASSRTDPGRDSLRGASLSPFSINLPSLGLRSLC